MNTSTYPHRTFGYLSIARYLAWVAFVVLGFTGAKAQMITILNPSFELPVVSNGGPNYFDGAADWTILNGSAGAGVFSSTVAGIQPPAPSGAQMGFANSGLGLVQTVGATFAAGTTYTFAGSIGQREGELNGTSTGTLQIGTYTGGVFHVLAFQTTSVNSAGFNMVTGTYTPTAAEFGLPISVAFVNSGSAQILFDNVSLSASPAAAVPEPATSAMLAGAGILGLTWFLRRRKGAAAKTEQGA